MWGACVSVRRCSSASLGSGTTRKRASVAVCAAESRKPKMGCEVGGFSVELPLTLVDDVASRTTEENRATQKSRIGLLAVEESKVAQSPRRPVLERAAPACRSCRERKYGLRS